MTRKMNRREFLKLASVTLVGAVAAACGAPQPTTVTPKEGPPPTEAATQTPVVVEKEVEKQVTVVVPEGRAEPPMLAERVKAGKLPPVDERLPETPLVVGGRDAIGVYGGEVRMIHFDPVWFISNYDLNAERMLHYSDLDNKTIVPNILESWEVTPDGKSYTIRLRKGMKWSDGEPITTEDFRFWWEDVQTNKDLASGVGWQWRFGGSNAKLEFMDDFTFKVTFAGTFGNFPAHLTRWGIGTDFGYPSHYLKKFHNKYTDQAELDKQTADLKLENWSQLFWNKQQWGAGVWQGPANWKEYPTVSPWHIVDSPKEGLYLWERNPYYWKVDLKGNQLPYIDTMRYDYVSTLEAVKLKVPQGELDILGQHDVTIADYPFYKENEAKSNYVVGDYISVMSDREVLFPQHYIADDPVLTEIVQHPNFVKALSLAIDRNEVNESLFYGLARVGAMAPIPTSKYYKPAYGEAWAKYDPDQANKLLDEMGLDKKDSNGIRLRSDGQPLKFQIEHAGARVGPSTGKYTEMVVTFWREIGIDATTKEITSDLYSERMNNAQVHCGIWHADRCSDMLLHIEMQWFIPVGGGGQGGASNKWAAWYGAADKKAEGLIEPPEDIKKQFDLFDKMTEVVDENERVKYGQQIFDWLADNPLEIGLILECPAPLLFNKNMRNLPRPKALIGWDSYGLSTYHPEAFFYEGGQRA